jgi:hypothetical protein
VKACDDQFAFETGRQLRIAVAEFGECLLDRVDGLDPAEQTGIGLGDLERYFGSLASVCGHRQRLLESPAGRLTARRCLGPRGLAKNPDLLFDGRRFGERPDEEIGGCLRSAAVHRVSSGVSESRRHPCVPNGASRHQMGGHLARWCMIGLQ